MSLIANPFFSRDNILFIRDALIKSGVPKVDPKALAHVMFDVARELKIHLMDGFLRPMNEEVFKRMLELSHPEARYMDEVNELPDKAPSDVTFRDDTSGQPPQFEEKEITLPPHLANQIQWRPPSY
jgi:hypothetical protein